MAQYVKRYHQNLTSNTNGTTIEYRKRNEGLDGELLFHASGDFGGGTLKIQFVANNGVWKDLSTGSFTSAVDKVLTVPIATQYRVVLSGSTSPTIYYEFSIRGEGQIFLDF